MSPAFAIVGALVINHVLNRRYTEQRNAAEAVRLAAALAVELKTLRDIYNENLELLARDTGGLLSTRAATTVFRASIARLTMLMDEKAVAPVVTAFAHNERIEAALAVVAARRGKPDELPLEDMKQRYVRGNRHVAAALIALAAIAEPAGVAVRPKQKAEAPVALLAVERSG